MVRRVILGKAMHYLEDRKAKVVVREVAIGSIKIGEVIRVAVMAKGSGRTIVGLIDIVAIVIGTMADSYDLLCIVEPIISMATISANSIVLCSGGPAIGKRAYVCSCTAWDKS